MPCHASLVANTGSLQSAEKEKRGGFGFLRVACVPGAGKPKGDQKEREKETPISLLAMLEAACNCDSCGGCSGGCLSS